VHARPQSAAHCFIVHIRLVLVNAPQTWDGLRVDELKDATLSVDPSDIAWTVVGVLQQLKQEFPEVNPLSSAFRSPGHSTAWWRLHCMQQTNAECNYLRQGGNVFARLCCLFVCLCVSKMTQKVMDFISEILRICREWHKLTVIQFWGWSGKNPRFWITLKFSLPLLSMGHKGNCCKTEDGAAT